MQIEQGKTYTAYGQGNTITTQTRQVTVVWVAGENVHYRLEGTRQVKQTTLDRFIEVVTPPRGR